MFKNLLGFWQGRHFIAQVFNDFGKMLDASELMFRIVCEHMIENTDDPGLEKRVRETDQQVNVLQREIRKRIVEHLTLQPTVEITACLVLMSVVKDAERLGDYCKNLCEVAKMLQKPLDRERYEGFFGATHQDILELFGKTKDAFIDTDEQKARATHIVKERLAKSCDAIIERLAESDLTVNEAVCYTLIARHYKRIVVHLANVATSVVLPLSDLDYWDETRD